ncbi:MAG: aldehyde dehydrogenase family protein [Ottowia sp.]|nr:aldehyde dehydrogenase family protein [Ottowia sp.]
MYTLREPGVTGHIIPWNGPLTQAGRGIAPALAAGNSAVVKPDENTCATTLELAWICLPKPACRKACSTSSPATAPARARPSSTTRWCARSRSPVP